MVCLFKKSSSAVLSSSTTTQHVDPVHFVTTVTQRSFGPKELHADLKKRVEATFPYVKVIFPAYTLRMWFHGFECDLHPEYEHFWWEEIILIALLCVRLIEEHPTAASKKQLCAVLRAKPVPTVEDLAKPETVARFQSLSGPSSTSPI